MRGKFSVGFRYCGGCNPRFDRVGVVRKLQEEFPDVSFDYAEENRQYAAILIVCGCHAACANQTGLPCAAEKLVITSKTDIPAAKALLQRLRLQ